MIFGTTHVCFAAVVPTETPKTDRMSTYYENTDYDLFISQDSLVGFQQIEEGTK